MQPNYQQLAKGHQRSVTLPAICKRTPAACVSLNLNSLSIFILKYFVIIAIFVVIKWSPGLVNDQTTEYKLVNCRISITYSVKLQITRNNSCILKR